MGLGGKSLIPLTWQSSRRRSPVEFDVHTWSMVRKGVLTNEEVLEEVKAVRREMERKRGR